MSLQICVIIAHCCVCAGVAPDAPLMDSGLDSLGAVEFRSSLEARLSVPLPPTLVFDYPSLSAIVGYLDDTLAAQQARAAPTSTTTAVKPLLPAPVTGPSVGLMGGQGPAPPVIAVLATHGRFPQPHAASGVALHDGITVVPAERYDVEWQLTEDMPARFGSFICGAQVRSKCFQISYTAVDALFGRTPSIHSGGAGCPYQCLPTATPPLRVQLTCCNQCV